MSLKLEYQLRVVEPKQKHLKGLVDQVIKHCRDQISKGEELPYVLELEQTEINYVHDLTNLLKEEGISSSACFTGDYSSIEVTVAEFI